MAAIKQEDVIDSIADAFQYISYYHPKDYIDALALAYEKEESPGEGRYCSNIDEFKDECRGSPTSVPRYRCCRRVRQAWHGRVLGGRYHATFGNDS